MEAGMSDWMAVSVIGRDRPGIVASVAKVLFQNRCNIEDLSQTAIRGQFAMILIASAVQQDSHPGLKQDLEALAGDLDLEINLRPIKPEEMIVFDTGETEPFVITVRGKTAQASFTASPRFWRNGPSTLPTWTPGWPLLAENRNMFSSSKSTFPRGWTIASSRKNCAGGVGRWEFPWICSTRKFFEPLIKYRKGSRGQGLRYKA